MEVSASLGGLILDAFPEASVDVHNPQLTLSVEIREKIYVLFRNYSGTGRNAGWNKRKGNAASFRRN